jgi:hypothetical protein
LLEGDCVMIDYLKEGTPLITLDGNRVSNAVYVSCDELGYHAVVSDFGNKMCFSTQELLGLYRLHEDSIWYVQMDCPFESLKERWQGQIALLTMHLKEHNGE